MQCCRQHKGNWIVANGTHTRTGMKMKNGNMSIMKKLMKTREMADFECNRNDDEY